MNGKFYGIDFIVFNKFEGKGEMFLVDKIKLFILEEYI